MQSHLKTRLLALVLLAITFVVASYLVIHSNSLLRMQAGARQGPAHPWNGAEDQEWIDRAFAALRWATLEYHAPERMWMGESKQVSVRIGMRRAEELPSGGSLQVWDGVLIGQFPTRVSPRMKVFLRSGDFDVTPLSSEEQSLATGKPTDWAWSIAPKRTGKLDLHLVTYVEIGKMSTDYRSEDIMVEVDVDRQRALRHLFTENASGIFGAIGVSLLGALGYFAKRWIERRDKKAQS